MQFLYKTSLKRKWFYYLLGTEIWKKINIVNDENLRVLNDS